MSINERIKIVKSPAFRNARQALNQKGWTHVLSVMDDSHTGTDYGSLFTKDGKKFWMNYETFMKVGAL